MEKSFSNATYTIGKLDAFEQLHVARRLGPAAVTVLQSFMAFPDGELSTDTILQLMIGIAGMPIADIFAKMSNDDVNYVLRACLSACQRKQPGGYSKILNSAGSLMFADIELDAILSLTYAVLQENLGRFFPTSQSAPDQAK